MLTHVVADVDDWGVGVPDSLRLPPVPELGLPRLQRLEARP